MVTPPVVAKPLIGLSRRNVLIAIVVVALIFVTVRVVHGSGAKKPVHTPHRATAACVATARRAHHRTTCRPTHAIPAKHHHSPGKRKPTQRHVPPVPHLTSLQWYARGLLPVVVRSVPLFNAAEAAAQVSSTDVLFASCGSYSDKIQALTDQVDGVPHPGAWYGTVAALHYQVLGVYHDMESALLVCVTGADNVDFDAINTARQDLVQVNAHLRDLRTHVWWIGYRQK